MNAKTLFAVSLVVVVVLPYAVFSFSIKELIKGNSGKRSGVECPAWHPFQCPNGDCVPIKYLCDGSPDCSDGYDENESMCTAATRPPVEETANFLTALLTAHGDSFLTKVFGEKAASSFAGMGGVEKVAVALSRTVVESPTANVFAKSTGMSDADEAKMITVMQSILDGNEGELSPNESADFAFFVQKLHETGFF